MKAERLDSPWDATVSHLTCPRIQALAVSPPAPGSEPATASVCVVIPVYNEALTVATVIEKVLQQPCVRQVIVVDDHSRDETGSVLKALAQQDERIEFFQHERNRGKGAALRTGFAQARAPIVLIQDADLEYDPAAYADLIEPIVSGLADVVYGSRFLSGRRHRVLYYWHRLGNLFITTLSNMATDLNLTDIETCYKVFRREVLQRLVLEEDRFGVEPEITAKLAKMRPAPRIYEIGIAYHGRTYAEGKKITWRDGFRALWCIFKYNLLRRAA
jgi:glycosyltransferase involved in cell wall biosynthesis